MWKKKIRMRKLQYLMIFLILMIATAILSGCISFNLETKAFIKDYFHAKDCPLLFSIHSSEAGIEDLKESKEIAKYIERIEENHAKIIDSCFFVNNERIDCNQIMLYAIGEDEKVRDYIQIKEGDTNAPKDNEIWICNIFADAYDIKLNDEISFGTKKERKQYKVASIITTPECSSGFLDNYVCYVNDSTLEEIELPMLYGAQLYAIDDSVVLKDVIDCYPESFNEGMVYSMGAETCEMCVDILVNIFAAVGDIAALIIIGVAIVIIRYLVKSTIAKEYRMIGIYKTLGKSNKEIMSIYFISYLVTGFAGAFMGILFARPFSLFLDRAVLGDGFEFENKTYLVGIICLIGIVLAVAINLWMTLRKISKITPLQALSVGQSSSKEKINRSLIRNAYHPVSMAINQCVKNRRMTILVIVILTVSFYMNLMSSATGWTLLHYEEQRDIWENLPDYDAYIKINGEKEVIDYIKENDQIKDYVIADIAMVCSNMTFENSDLTGDSANPMIYNNFTKERYKDVPFTEGRICVNDHEITCSESFLKEVGKKVGDYIKISIDEKSSEFLIVGKYSAMMKGGTSFYMQEADARELGYEPELTTILLWFSDGVSFKDFEASFQERFHTAILYEDFAFIAQEGDTVAQIAIPICIVIVFAFVAISLLNIVNLVYTQLCENRKRYGVQKAMGFSTRYIRCEFLARLGIESLVAIVIALVLHKFLSPILFSLACGINFIMSPIWLTASVIVIMSVLIFAITLIMIRTIKKISPVELMEE